MPDTWRDALLRPIAMAAPDAMVYIEIMAPDFRFIFVIGLLLVWGIAIWRLKWRVSATGVLLLFVFLAFPPWLASTGNGRYFIPVLLVTGPLCVGLVYWLPWTRFVKMAFAVLMVIVQTFAVSEASPWQRWSLASWAEAPFFEVSLDDQMAQVPSTYVTVSSNTFSIIAPMFSDSSRWVNIASLKNQNDSLNGRRLKSILEGSTSLKLIVPAVVAYTTDQGLPNETLRNELARLLQPQKLALADQKSCKLLPSKGVEKMLTAEKMLGMAKTGFWMCDLRYRVEATVSETNFVDPKIERVFELLENNCPRFFPPGTAYSTKIEGGTSRGYSESDMKLYVMEEGRVYYKYWKGLNTQLIGDINEVLSGAARMDCNHIRGRSGLPWERQI